MKSPDSSSQRPSPPSSQHPSELLTEKDLSQFAIALSETEKDFQALQQRFQEVCQANHDRTQLVAQIAEATLPQAELKRLQKQIEELEVILENRLLSWDMLKEPFWQALRFGGLGLIVGWALKAWVG